jgi:L-amino acid N-acyltransferase YncA
VAVAIRAATGAHADAISGIYAPMVQRSVASFEEWPPDADEMRRRMLAEPRLPWLVAVDGDRVAGYAYASRHRQRAAYRWSADVSIYLDDAYHGRGIGRALYGRLIPEVRDLGYVTLFAGIALPNPRSIGLHESFGFRPVGVFGQVGFKHGAWRDVGWWQLPLEKPPVPPQVPRAWRPPDDPVPRAAG